MYNVDKLCLHNLDLHIKLQPQLCRWNMIRTMQSLDNDLRAFHATSIHSVFLYRTVAVKAQHIKITCHLFLYISTEIRSEDQVLKFTFSKSSSIFYSVCSNCSNYSICLICIIKCDCLHNISYEIYVSTVLKCFVWWHFSL